MNNVTIIDWDPQYAEAFYNLNAQWIKHHFTMEMQDKITLENPQEYIIDKGGHIVFALLDGKPVGTVALIKMEDPNYDYELAKMGVSPAARNKKIGLLLANEILKRAKNHGAKAIYLESNTSLVPAINLYRKLGFEELKDRSSPYERSDIQMGLML